MTPADDSETGFDDLPLSSVLRINACCDAFEAALRAGMRPDIDTFLNDATDAERDVLREHLGQIEAEYREPTAAEFADRLHNNRLIADDVRPDHESTSREWAESLVAAGILTRYQAETLLSPKPHALVLNDYVITDRLARGGMGTVYCALHRRLKRTVALKVVGDGRGTRASRHTLFLQEIEAAGRLVHPNIVTAYDAGEARGISYLVSEFVDGTDLHRLVETQGPLSPAEAMRAIRDAASGLAFAHGQGVIHRDVKPSNLIRTAAGTVRVLDVGLARFIHDGDAEKSRVVGTPDFMAPEQATNPDSVDARSDVYGLGGTLFYLLTGRAMFAVGSVDDRMAAHQKDERPSLTDSAPGVPRAVDDLYRRMTARVPADRPASMAEVIAAIDAMARPRRRRLIVLGLLTVALAMIALMAWPGPERDVTMLEVPFDGAAAQADCSRRTGLPVRIEPVSGLVARLIPAGRFVAGTPADAFAAWMPGSPENAIRVRIQAEPQIRAIVDSPFYISATEVTVAQYRRFVQLQSYLTLAERPGGTGYRLAGNGDWQIVSGANWQSAGQQSLTDDHPVCNLGRDDCAAYCRWLNDQLAGKFTCRLPTEEEWEFACRAGSAGYWTTGDDRAEVKQLAWYAGNIDPADSQLRPVARKAANAFGLFDMHGNIAEWCSSNRADAGCVLRGGNIRSPSWEVRSASRDLASANTPRGGFRVVLIPRLGKP
ncbi:MAG: SUMF1/EgtB/PvdO family nonheme iron enzyme [Gemmataceae bacterium]|nr:SUMF1/EgtB/PvdO family nonheme iron enzyme [Gemmataceae bacterium]